jgi:hypothetical protein
MLSLFSGSAEAFAWLSGLACYSSIPIPLFLRTFSNFSNANDLPMINASE